MNDAFARLNAALNEVQLLAPGTFVSIVFFAIIHLGLEGYEGAMRWLEKGYE